MKGLALLLIVSGIAASIIAYSLDTEPGGQSQVVEFTMDIYAVIAVVFGVTLLVVAIFKAIHW